MRFAVSSFMSKRLTDYTWMDTTGRKVIKLYGLPKPCVTKFISNMTMCEWFLTIIGAGD